jgi:hypothetical protein
VCSPSQTPVPTKENTTKKDDNKRHALRGIPTHDFSEPAIKAFASDSAATGTDCLTINIGKFMLIFYGVILDSYRENLVAAGGG